MRREIQESLTSRAAARPSDGHSGYTTVTTSQRPLCVCAADCSALRCSCLELPGSLHLVSSSQRPSTTALHGAEDSQSRKREDCSGRISPHVSTGRVPLAQCTLLLQFISQWSTIFFSLLYVFFFNVFLKYSSN